VCQHSKLFKTSINKSQLTSTAPRDAALRPLAHRAVYIYTAGRWAWSTGDGCRSTVDST